MICWDTRKLPPRLCKRNNNNSKPAPRLLTVANLAASGWHHEYILFEKKKNYKIKAFWLWYSSCEAEGVEDVYRISLKKKREEEENTHTHTKTTLVLYNSFNAVCVIRSVTQGRALTRPARPPL